MGCSGWQYASWRGVLYPPRCPQRDWLEVYARRFRTVEVNATFYRLPNRDAVARWTEQVPPEFVAFRRQEQMDRLRAFIAINRPRRHVECAR